MTDQEGHIVDERSRRTWTFLTSHARVVALIAQNPDIRTRDLATMAEITERSAQRIVSDLEEAGYLTRERSGRRNHYLVSTNATLRHPNEREIDVRTLLGLFSQPKG